MERNHSSEPRSDGKAQTGEDMSPLLLGDGGLRWAVAGRFGALRLVPIASPTLALPPRPSVHNRMSVTLQSLHSGLD